MGVTGAALSPDKSWWYLVNFVFSRGKWIAHDTSPDTDLVAPNKSGELVSLKRLFANEVSKMLGVWVAPEGNAKKLVRELKLKAVEWGAKVRFGNHSNLEA